MKIKGIEGLTIAELNEELSKGGKFIVYQYSISVLIMTFKRNSNVYFVKSNESKVFNGIVYIAISLLFGWWGIPWGPIYTIQTLFKDLLGGIDVTKDVVSSLAEDGVCV